MKGETRRGKSDQLGEEGVAEGDLTTSHPSMDSFSRVLIARVRDGP